MTFVVQNWIRRENMIVNAAAKVNEPGLPAVKRKCRVNIWHEYLRDYGKTDGEMFHVILSINVPFSILNCSWKTCTQ